MSLLIVYCTDKNLNYLNYLSDNLSYLKKYSKRILFILPLEFNNQKFKDLNENNDESIFCNFEYPDLKSIISEYFLNLNGEITLYDYKSIILFNCQYLILREINEIFYGKNSINSIVSTENEIFDILVNFSPIIFEDYLQFFTPSEKENEIIKEDVSIIGYINSLYSLEQYNDIKSFPLIKISLINENIDLLKKQLVPYSHLNIDKYCELTRKVSDNFLQTIENPRYLTIYCYYEKDGYTKNQTNFQHFIKHGLKIPNMDYIFIINGYKCSVNIPYQNNIKVIYEDNCMDFEGWYNALLQTEWYHYRYIFFMNCSVLGPLNLNNSNIIVEDWFTPFLNKMDSNTVLCSNIITNLPSINPGGPGPRCTSYNFLLDSKMIPLLMTQRISGNTKEDIMDYYNPVFSKKKDRKDAIFTGEYGLSRVILDFGYKITCLHPGYSDRIGDRDPCISMTLFMKNNWIDGKMRASPPVQYKRCMEIIGKEIKEPPEDFDYESLNCQESGICYKNVKYNWNSKKEFYEKFGYAEEIKW